ncbi:hypothetical protein pb186bvf_011953 [Paramecium bursaria]
MIPSTFIQQPLPVPTQIYNQRINQTQIIQQQQQQQMELQSNYVYKINQDQRRRFQEVTKKQEYFVPEAQPPTKAWMGEDVYMVSFLLSVELERLQAENLQLQQYIELNETRNKGLEFMEMELHQSRLKMGEYEKRIALLQNDLEQWKTKSLNKEKETEDLRYQQELQRRVQLDREIRELTARFIQDRNQLDQQNQQLKAELDQLKLKKGSLDDVLMSAESIQNENTKLKKELEKLKHGFDELEYVLKTASELEQENSYLKEKLAQQSFQVGEQEILALRQQNEQLRRQIDSLSNSQQTNPTIQRLTQELNQYKLQNKDLSDKLAAKSKNYGNTYTQR